jgi:hypothetical protein
MKLFLVVSPIKKYMTTIRNSDVKNILISYFYWKDVKPPELLDFFKEMQSKGVTIFLDSGAFTFINQQRKNKQLVAKDKLTEYFFQFTNDYIGFIKQYYNYIAGYAEMDVDTVIGFQKVLALRNLFPQEILPKLIPVYHPETRTMEDWKHDCNNYPFVALGSKTGSTEMSYYKTMTKYPYQNGNKVHGFALVNQTILKKYPFYSADSSSWMSCSRYGQLMVFDKALGRLVQFHYRNREKILKYLPTIMKYVPNFKEMYEREGVQGRISRIERLKVTASSYKELEEYLTRVWERKGITWSED